MRNRRMAHKRRKDMQGILLLAAVLLAVGVIVAWVVVSRLGQVERDPNTLCRKDHQIPRETVLLLDATDSFTPGQALVVRKTVDRLLRAAWLDERFSLYVLDDKADEARPLLRVCNPGDGREKSALTHNVRRLRQAWEQAFHDRVSEAVSRLTGDHQAAQSPILHMLALVSADALYGSPAPEKRLIVVSDMLEHTADYSHYRKLPDWDAFARSPQAALHRAWLADTEVEILYLVRRDQVQRQTRRHIHFWEQWVATNGGAITHVLPIN